MLLWSCIFLLLIAGLAIAFMVISSKELVYRYDQLWCKYNDDLARAEVTIEGKGNEIKNLLEERDYVLGTNGILEKELVELRQLSRELKDDIAAAQNRYNTLQDTVKEQKERLERMRIAQHEIMDAIDRSVQ